MRRSGAGAAGLAGAGVVSAAVVLALTGCAGAAQPVAPGAAASSSTSTTPPPVFAWPDPALVVVTTPKGTRPPLDLTWATPGSLQDQVAQERGVSLEEGARTVQDQELMGVYTYDVAERFLDAFAMSHAGEESSQGRPWVAFTGTVPPEAVVMAERLPFPVELRGGALVSSHRNGVVIDAARTAFLEDLGAPEHGVALGGGFDATTGVVTIEYSTDLLSRRPDAGTEAAVVAAAQGALGWDAPLSVDLQADDRDPTSTVPAFWYLPAGWVADPAATSIEVVVDSPQCAGGVAPGERMAPPQVEVTDTQVRIAVSTYIRKGPQACLGHGTSPLLVDLGQPLGDRQLVDVNGAVEERGSGPGGGLVTPSAG